MELTSTRNSLLQKVRRAVSAGRPTEDGLIVAEGPHLLEEANRGTWTVEQVFVSAAAGERYRGLLAKIGAEVVEVSERALAAASATETPQNILALMRPRPWAWRDLSNQCALWIVLDRIQDPGNLGTIVRSAEAFGASGVVFLKGCARVANGKVLRAAAGSLFRMPFLEQVSGSELIQNIQSARLRLFALSAQAKTAIGRTDLRIPCALLVGSEATGVSPELLAQAEGLSIPTVNVESLNAAVACSIALYEVRRQRRGI
jgi:TrmH family RNA methyltransferase